MKITPIQDHKIKNNFKGWEAVEVSDYASVDECPGDDRVCSSTEIVGTHIEYEWKPKYEDYFSKETIAKDIEAYGNSDEWKEHVKLECKARIRAINKEEKAPRPYFGIFGKYRGIIKTYLANFEAAMNNQKEDVKEEELD